MKFRYLGVEIGEIDKVYTIVLVSKIRRIKLCQGDALAFLFGGIRPPF